MQVAALNTYKNVFRRSLSRPILQFIRGLKQVMINEENNVKTVILDNPKTRNALSFSMLEELKEAILSYNSDLRCIVLKAEGKVFSSGHNLKELVGETGKSFHNEIFQTCTELMIGITKLPFPVIAQVNGVAAAAGCQLVASCDIVIASETSSFVTPGASFGIFCSTPGIPLVRNVPPKVSADMLLTGLPISANEAYSAGLVSTVVPVSELEKETQKRVDAICSKSRSVIALGKKFMYEQKEMDIEEAYSLGRNIMVNNVNMQDGQEGIKSFIEKRKPLWSNEEH